MPPELFRPLPLGPLLLGPLLLGTVGPGPGAPGHAERLEATADECAALARRFGIVSIESLRADLVLRPEPDGAVQVTGRLVAALTQSCVVSFEPVAQQVTEPVAFRLLPAGREPADGPDEIDEIPTEGGVADLGEAIAEQLALALDPYPRAPDAALPAEAQDDGRPFRSLATLRRPK